MSDRTQISTTISDLAKRQAGSLSKKQGWTLRELLERAIGDLYFNYEGLQDHDELQITIRDYNAEALRYMCEAWDFTPHQLINHLISSRYDQVLDWIRHQEETKQETE